MRILTVLDYYHPHWTGLTVNAQLIAEGLARRGHEVTVLTVRHDPQSPPREIHRDVAVVRTQPLARFSRGLLSPALPAAAYRLIPQSDVVHMHTPMIEALLVAALCRARRRPLVMTHQGDLVMPSGVLNAVIQRAGNAMLAAAARLSTRVTTFTRDYAEHSPVLRPALETLVPLLPPITMPEPDAEEVERVRALISGRPIVGFAGRFVEEKGFDFLLRAIPSVLEAAPETQFAFAGEHDMRYERFFERCAPLLEPWRDRVHLLGLIRDRRRIASFYAACDVVVVPSRTDCFASVLVEAMLSGTPVVASDIPGTRQAVALTGMGTTVRPRDPASLAAGITDVLRNRERYAAAAPKAAEVFDAERTLDRYEELLDAAAGTDEP